jgi:prepilin-type N-terminal cleavage/methylation domain-containing protein
MHRQETKGFSLFELMIVVVIVGVLAAVAIPAFTRYVRRARTTEAVSHLNKLWTGSVSYYSTEFTQVVGGAPVIQARQFPGPVGAWEWGNNHCCMLAGAKCPGNSPVWGNDLVWLALKFAIPDPHNYVPGYTGAGVDTGSTFTAVALGNLDCDGDIAEFRREGFINASGDVAGQAQPEVVNELE